MQSKMSKTGEGRESKGPFFFLNLCLFVAISLHSPHLLHYWSVQLPPIFTPASQPIQSLSVCISRLLRASLPLTLSNLLSLSLEHTHSSLKPDHNRTQTHTRPVPASLSRLSLCLCEGLSALAMSGFVDRYDSLWRRAC